MRTLEIASTLFWLDGFRILRKRLMTFHPLVVGLPVTIGAFGADLGGSFLLRLFRTAAEERLLIFVNAAVFLGGDLAEPVVTRWTGRQARSR